MRDRYLLAVCQPAEYEMLHPARDSAEATRIGTWPHAFAYPPTDDDSFARAPETQRHTLNAGFHRALAPGRCRVPGGRAAAAQALPPPPAGPRW